MPGKHELAGPLQLLLGQAEQFFEQIAHSRALHVELFREVREELHLAHAPGVCHAFISLAGARVIETVVEPRARTVRRQIMRKRGVS